MILLYICKIITFFLFTGFIFFFFLTKLSAQVGESFDVRHVNKANPKAKI